MKIIANAAAGCGLLALTAVPSLAASLSDAVRHVRRVGRLAALYGATSLYWAEIEGGPRRRRGYDVDGSCRGRGVKATQPSGSVPRGRSTS